MQFYDEFPACCRKIYIQLIQPNSGQTLHHHSVLQELDFGTILCWAENIVGQQKEPCVFHLIAAGKPDAPYNCTIVNQTSESLEVECNEGLNSAKIFSSPPAHQIEHNRLSTIFSLSRLCARSLLSHSQNNRIWRRPTTMVYYGNFRSTNKRRAGEHLIEICGVHGERARVGKALENRHICRQH